MNLLLFLFLALELILIYQFNGKDILSPSFISCCGFIISTAILMYNYDYFKYELGINTIFIIISMLMSIFIGEMTARHVHATMHKNTGSRKFRIRAIANNTPIRIPNVIIYILFSFVTISGFMYLYDTYTYSLSIGNTLGNVFGSAQYTRFIGGYSSNILISQANVLSECIIYFSFYVYAFNRINYNNGKKIYLLPASGFIFHVLANDGRSVIIKYACIFCIMYFALYKQKHNWVRGNNKKLLKISLFSVLIFLVIFRLLGYRTGASLVNTFQDNLAEYISSGLVGFDMFIKNGPNPNSVFGQHILTALYATLRGWGFPIPVINSHGDFFTFAGGKSNIYTGLMGYINDFSLIGAYVAMFFLGFIIIKFKTRIIRYGTSLINLYLLGLVFYPVSMLSIAGATHVVLSMPTIYSLFYLSILNSKISIRKKKKNLNRIAYRSC